MSNLESLIYLGLRLPDALRSLHSCSNSTITSTSTSTSTPKTIMDLSSCCTCASLLSALPSHASDKKRPRSLPCCNRIVCARCLAANPRFATYCPFCQISFAQSSALPPAGLRAPPAYSPAPPHPTTTVYSMALDADAPPPPYTAGSYEQKMTQQQQQQQPAEDVLHFIDASQDSVGSLSLRYGVPAAALRAKNALYSDHLLLARQTILIPGEFYKGGVSLSAGPVGGEEEMVRKSKIRRWMVACKVAEYDVALLYLQLSEYDLEKAIEAYRADERWEQKQKQKQPSESARNGRARATARKSIPSSAGGFAGQLR